uniref:Uncharacterized protein n=1 Tax=Pipistrellus kuhlii TaxID=59472 RepID=A0A7J7V0S0_PIPKU|nr:hypothetical protein mPipKuh1_008652 [Pipistrellus kuhlii]
MPPRHAERGVGCCGVNWAEVPGFDPGLGPLGGDGAGTGQPRAAVGPRTPGFGAPCGEWAGPCCDRGVWVPRDLKLTPSTFPTLCHLPTIPPAQPAVATREQRSRDSRGCETQGTLGVVVSAGNILGMYPVSRKIRQCLILTFFLPKLR